METSFTLGQAKEMLAVIEALRMVGVSARFALALARNRQRLQPEVAAWEEARAPLPDYLPYDQERVDLCKEMCVRDVEGRCRMVWSDTVQQYLINPAKQPEFDKRLARLRKKHQKALEAREAQLQEAEALLAGICQVELDRVSLEHFPDGLTPAQMEILLPILAEEKGDAG